MKGSIPTALLRASAGGARPVENGTPQHCLGSEGYGAAIIKPVAPKGVTLSKGPCGAILAVCGIHGAGFVGERREISGAGATDSGHCGRYSFR